MKEFVHSGRKLLAQRSFQEAVKVCRLGLLDNPASVEGRLVLAQALMSLARYDEVIAEARAALELQKDSAPAAVLLGEALFFKGAYGQARKSLQRAAELDPDNLSVARLLDELDATAEVGALEPIDDVGNTTRAYPDDIENVGDETEIQELPGALQGDPEMLPDQETAANESSEASPSLDVSQAASDSEPSSDHEARESSDRAAVEAANRAAEDQHRPDPVAGEVRMASELRWGDANGPSAPVIKVDVSKVGSTPPPEAPPPSGSLSDDPAQPDGSGQPEPPLRSDPREGSQSGARRWSDRKWIGPDDAATREAVVVPTPSISTEEMNSSDLFGRKASSTKTKAESGLGRRQLGAGFSDNGSPEELHTVETKLLRPDPSGARPRPTSAPELHTVETKLSRPDPSGARPRPTPGTDRPSDQLPIEGARRDEISTAPLRPSGEKEPWDENDEQPTVPLVGSAKVSAPSSSRPGARPPGSTLSRQKPPPPPAPPGPLSPFRTSGAATPGSEPRRPPLPSPAGSNRSRRPPPLPSPGHRAPPPPPASGHAAPGSPQPPGAARPQGDTASARSSGFAHEPPGLSGVHFDAPPAAPPPGSPTPRPALPGGQIPPAGVAPGPALSGPVAAVGAAPAETGPGASHSANPDFPPPSPISGVAAPHDPDPLPAQQGSAPASEAVAPKPPVRDLSADPCKPPGWVRTHWRALLLGIAGVVLVSVVLLLIGLLRKDEEGTRARQSIHRARVQADGASYRSLRQADRMLLKVLQASPGHKEARSLRSFVAAVLAVEFGDSADRVEQMLEKGGLSDNDLAAAARVLAALSSGDTQRTATQTKKAATRWPRSPYVSYARGVVALRQGSPAKSLALVDSMATERAGNLLLRIKMLALLDLDQLSDLDKCLNVAAPAVRKTPWYRLLSLRRNLARSSRPLPKRSLAPLLAMTAKSADGVSPRQRRWALFLLAEDHGRLEKDVERQRYLAQTLAGEGFRDPALAEAVASHLLAHRQPAKAHQIAQMVRRRYPLRKTAILLVAQSAMARGKLKDALAQLDRVQEPRRTPDMNLVRAQAALGLGRVGLAKRILTDLRKSYPNLTGALVTWAKLMTQEGRLTEALSALEEVLKKDPRNVEVIRDAASLELRRGKAADAVIRLEVAVRLRPRDPDLRAELVRAYLAAGSFKAAETALETALGAFSSSPAILAAKGHLMRTLGRYPEALKAFDAALARKPKLPDALLGRAEVLLASGQIDKAIDAVKKASGPAPEMRRLFRGWLALLRWSRAKRDRWRARTLLSAAARQKGSVGLRAAVLLLEYYAKAMDRRAGERTYKLLVKRFGPHPSLRSALALVRLDDDSYNAAKAQLGAALASPAFSKLSPTDRARIHARLAHAHWLAGNYGAASRRAKKALKIWPSCPRGLAILGVVAYELARFERARRYLERGLRANPLLALAHHYLGKAFKQLGRRNDGRRHLRTYLRLRPKGPLATDTKRAL